MKISSAVKPLVIAGFTAMPTALPVAAQTSAPSTVSTDAVYGPAETRVGLPYCHFTQTSKGNLISDATVFTAPQVIRGVSFGKGDIVYGFGSSAEYLERGNDSSMTAILLDGRPTGAQQAQYALTFATENPQKPSLLDRCMKAQAELALGPKS